MTQEQEDEFTRELNKMISNTGPSASASASSTSALGSGTVIAKKGLLDVQVPFVKRIVRKVEEDDEEGVEKVETGMRFTLLTKKGKSQVCSLYNSLVNHSCETDVNFILTESIVGNTTGLVDCDSYVGETSRG